ncbi:MAG: acetate/propionate family kinase [Patescibacteria group bacterium]
MARKILTVNPGSDSRKYALFIGDEEAFSARLENEDGRFVASLKINGAAEKKTIGAREYENGGAYFLAALVKNKLIKDGAAISAAGVRIVAPGEYFLKTRPLDRPYLQHLKSARPAAPLHIDPALQEIETLSRLLHQTPLFGVSDSAFHASLPDRARLYAVSLEAAYERGIRRYGYHGLSVQSVLRTAGGMPGGVPFRTIVCHLGSGASVTAVKNGKSADTSMGFTPLEGLPMRTRPGDLDAGALIYLAKETGMTIEQLEEYLNKKCGLLGLAGQTKGGVRELLELENGGDLKAKAALELFAYRTKKYIGAYAAALGGLDLLIFTGAIGERSAAIRSRVCEELEFLGVAVDAEKNGRLLGEENGSVEKDGYPVKIAAVKTDEEREIALETAAAINK